MEITSRKTEIADQSVDQLDSDVEWPIRRIDTVTYRDPADEGAKYRAIIESGLHKLAGNKHAYWSSTALVYRNSREDMAGCCHDLIVALVPDLAPVVAVHLADENGTPMYAIANGMYHLGLSAYPDALNLDAFARLWRLTAAETETTKAHVAEGDDSDAQRAILESIATGMAFKWKTEADRARAACSTEALAV